MNELDIRLLGSPSVVWQGRSIDIPRRQVRALLYRLAAQSVLISRDELCVLLWPELPDDTARRNLSRLLSQLRGVLPRREVLVSKDGYVGLDDRYVWSDVVEFESLINDARSEHEIALLQKSIDHYRGEFLEGFYLTQNAEYEEWISTQRRYRERQYLEVLTSLIQKYRQSGDYLSAIALAERYLTIDELAEDIHRELIHLYAISGDRSAAIRQFEWCAAVLERGLGVSPLPETRQVYQTALKEIAVRQPFEPPTWTTLPSLDAPLIGRSDVISELNHIFGQVRSGKGWTVLLSGEPGIGKTRLIEEFVYQHHDSATVLVGNSYEAERGMPFWPLIEALRSQLDAIDWEVVNVDAAYMQELARLLPALRSRMPTSIADLDQDTTQIEGAMFQALTSLFLELANDRAPFILCLDDLHWADDATRSWVTYFARRIQNAPVLVLVGCRSEEIDTSVKIRAELQRLNTYREFELSGLTQTAVLDLVQLLSGQSDGAELFSKRLYEETGGNPFFVLETLRAMFEKGALWQDEQGWSTDLDDVTKDYSELMLPESLEQAITSRIERLSPVALQVLEAGAILRPDFRLDHVRAVSGRRMREIVEALEELIRRQILAEAEGCYRFNHHLIQTVIYRHLSYGRRILLHRRAGELLERGRSTDVATLAWHFEHAGESFSEKAVAYFIEAGDRSRDFQAFRKAIDFYERAIKLLEQGQDDQRIARILMKLALTHHLSFDFKRAHKVYEHGFEAWQRSGVSVQASVHPAPHGLRLDWADPVTLDPSLASDFPSAGVIDQLFMGLVELRPNLDVVPAVARLWEVVEDGKQYVFHLREDIFWSDGVPVSARDFEYSWRRVLHPPTKAAGASLLFSIRGAQAYHQGDTSWNKVGLHAPNDKTLVVELEEPTSFFPHLLTSCTTYPLPSHVVESLGEGWTRPDCIVTNGPFTLDAWNRGKSLVLRRNPNYLGKTNGNIETVHLSLLADRSAQLQLYGDGELDVLDLAGMAPPLWNLARIKYANEFVSVPRLHTAYIGFDVTRPPFDDRRVRSAFAMATDKETLADVILHGRVSPATGGFLPPGMAAHCKGIGVSFDPARARASLADAGYGGGAGFPTVGLMAFQRTDPFAEYVLRQWKEHLGIDVQLRMYTVESFLNKVEKKRPLMFLTGNLADYPDPDDFLRTSPHLRRTGWWNETYTRLVSESQKATDPSRRLQMHQEADKILVQSAAVLPLTYGRSNFLVKPWVSRFPTSAIKPFFWQDVVIEPH